jgi:hypothetical protein
MRNTTTTTTIVAACACGLAFASLLSGAACSGDDGSGGSTTTSSQGGASTSSSSSTLTTSPGGTGGTPVCEPGDVADFEHDWKPSVGLSTGACSSAQIDDLFSECLLPGSSDTKCQTFTDDNPVCLQCAVSVPESDPMGPLILYQDLGLVDGNAGHCVSAFAGDDSPSSCGAKMDAAVQCGLYACADNCGGALGEIDTQAELDEFLTCLKDAAAGGCKTYDEAATACQADLLGKGDPIDQCIWDEKGETFWVYAERIVTLHCGGAEGGGGAGGGGAGGGGGS